MIGDDIIDASVIGERGLILGYGGNMEEEQKREYQSVILGALLHDVGKFLQRAQGKDAAIGEHNDISGDFIGAKNEFADEGRFRCTKFKKILDTLAKKEIDLDIVESIARYHSTPHTPRNKNLLELIANQADSYSSNERRAISERQGVGGSKFTPLYATFHKIRLDKEIAFSVFSYDAIKLDSMNSFPKKDKIRLDDNEISGLIKEFFNELDSINCKEEELKFDHFYNTLVAILEKYLCFIPSDKSLDYPDVSLFDHLRSSSAISACLFHYHSQTGTLINNNDNKTKVKDKSEKKFLLVGGEISGIQRYLYQISSITGEGGVAKRLRARSFYISILVEIIVFRILKTLNLPISCNLICSGGKFIILAPNTNETKSELAKEYKDISKWIIEDFAGEIILNLAWDVKICGNDFHMKSEEDIEDNKEYTDSNFYNCIKSLEKDLRSKRNNKFSEILICESNWNEDGFIRTLKYKEYEETGKNPCKSCGKFPVKYPDPHEEIHENNDEEKFCEKCSIDKVIGRKIIDAKYIAIGINSNGEKHKSEENKKLIERQFIFFFDNNYFIEILNTYKFDKDYLCIEKIRERKTEKESVKIGMVNRFIGNYVPIIENIENFKETLCKKKCKLKPDDCEHHKYIKDKLEQKHLYTFECIAAESSQNVIVKREEKLLGNQNIGILKADIDNLGLIFSEGLKERLTISRYLTVSRMIDLFFSGWLYRVLKEKDEYINIYTVYSGGDDLLLVGPWEIIIRFSQFLYEEFQRFVCNNENITLSAGISIVKPKQSISLSVEQAEINLKRSKEHDNKKSLTIWNTTIYWDEFKGVYNFMGILNKGYLFLPEILSRQFIHRLLKYHRMYLNYKEKNVIEGLMFHSKMSYDVRRNISERMGKKEEKELLIKIEDKQSNRITVSDYESNHSKIKGFIRILKGLQRKRLVKFNAKNLNLCSKIDIELTQKGKKTVWFIKTIPQGL
ncbi:MAG: type III-A CRISPR-associated protein Cas10/Csm1, partial [Nitrospirota bacterium]